MSLPLNIDDLIHQRKVESARIEYKKDWNPEKVLHSVCAFANDIDNWGGGYIILGVEEKNGSPDPQFYNPETRSFMTVILPIHEAFNEDESPVETETVAKAGMKTGMDADGTVNLPVNLPENLSVELTVTAKKIYHLLKEDGKYTYDRLAAAIGVTRETVRVSIHSLVKAKLISRIGPDKGGHWEVVK